MEIIKRIVSAIFLALILAFIEGFVTYSIIQIYQIPFLIKFEYWHVLGIIFILMVTRNKIRLPERKQKFKSFFDEIIGPTLNRIFRAIFVWSVAITICLIFLR